MNILLISLLGCLVVASASAQKVRWCVKTANELKKCKDLERKTDIDCQERSSLIECIKSIKNGEADAVTADGEHIYTAGLINYNLRPIIAELYKKGQECCYVVAVVKKSTNIQINDLSGKKSCHSCYQSYGGWNIPMGRMVADNKIKWEGPDDMPLEKAVSQFFSSSCIPGISKALYPNMCQSCQGDCSCSQAEPFYGGSGAFKCMKDDKGDVAFMCHDVVPVNERPDYKLLCRDGSWKSVEDYKSCHFAKEPGRAVLGRMDVDSQIIYNVLSKLSPSDLFTPDDLIFSRYAVGLVLLSPSTDSHIYLGDDYYYAMRALKEGNPKPLAQERKIEWCTVGHAEQQKCDSLQIPRIECRRASSVEECIKKVMRREADAFAADGGQVYIAGKCGLVPVMVEQRDEQSCKDSGDASSYYVVAVVRKDSGVTWDKLQGGKSCHTGLNRNAGWKVPDATICENKTDCTLYKFFSQGCAPGADPASNMCELCKGSGKAVGDKSKCKASSDEMYYGYDGAFRCLAEKAGDVAFTKHTVVGDYTEGKGPEWAKDLKADKFELICPGSPDKTFKFSDFKSCHLAKVPAHAVVTREDVRSDVVTVLKEAQISVKKLFVSEGERNLLFSDSTKCLQENTKPLEEFLTKPYIAMIERTYKTGQGVPDLVKACTMDNCMTDS